MNAAQIVLMHQVAVNARPHRAPGMVGGAGSSPQPENNRKYVVVAILGLLIVIVCGKIALLNH